MKILVDYQIFFSQRYGGISRYHADINNYINNIQTEHTSFISEYGCKNAYLSKTNDPLKILNRKGGRRILKTINKQIVHASLSKFDVFHPTYYDPYFLTFKNLPPYVVTVHDMILETHLSSTASDVIDNKRKIIDKASAVIAISNATKDELIRICNYDPQRIHVIYHGYPEYFNKYTNAGKNEKPGNASDYLLFVGNREFYKNFDFLIRSISPFIKRNQIRLKVIGPAATEKEIALISELKVEELVSFISNVNDADLFNYYKNALCFVFPSLAEGFGMPLLEAFMAECPVICTDIPVFREIADTAALYFEPSNSKSLVNALETIIGTQSLREELIESGKCRLQLFAWEQSAFKTLDVYESIIF